MSSYIIEHQSRGPGAIAAQDLGATARTSGSVTLSRVQADESALKPAGTAVQSPTRSYESPTSDASLTDTRIGTRSEAAETPALVSPTLTTSPGVTATSTSPASSSPTLSHTPSSPTPRLHEFAVDRRHYPYLEPSAYPGGSRLPQDVIDELDVQEAELLVPPYPEDNLWLWIVGGLAALWIVTRK